MSREEKIDQFVEFATAVMRSLPRNLPPEIMQTWIRDQKALAHELSKTLGEPVYKTYLAPGQESGGWMTGFDLEKHLQAEGLLERAYPLDDELVKGWLANPATYPEEFKGKAIFLWKSQWATGSVACLCWGVDRLVMHYHSLNGRWGGLDPALLHEI